MSACSACGAPVAGAYCSSCGSLLSTGSGAGGQRRAVLMIAVLIAAGSVVSFAIGSQSRTDSPGPDAAPSTETFTDSAADPSSSPAASEQQLPPNALQELQRAAGESATTAFVLREGTRPYGITLSNGNSLQGTVTNVTIWTYDSVGWHKESLLQTSAPVAEWSQIDATGDDQYDLVLRVVGAADSATQIVTTDACESECWEFANFIVDEAGHPGVGRTTATVVEGTVEPAFNGPGGDLVNSYSYCIPSCAEGADLSRTLRWKDNVGFEQMAEPEGVSG